MNKMKIKGIEMKIGDRVRDIEDGDCYYEGVITLLIEDEDQPLRNTYRYILDKVVWSGEEDLDYEELGDEITQRWWITEIIK